LTTSLPPEGPALPLPEPAVPTRRLTFRPSFFAV